jgi:transcriptional regulator with XRE-family HTH domain
MNELRGNLRQEFHDRDYRHAYADESLNTYIATQIKVLREQRGLTQKGLADLTGMAQPRIAVLEDVNYSSWSINTLRRLAEAFDLRLSVKFETFSSLIPEIEKLDRESLERSSFEDDSWFHKKDVQLVDSAILRAAYATGGESRYPSQQETAKVSSIQSAKVLSMTAEAKAAYPLGNGAVSMGGR